MTGDNVVSTATTQSSATSTLNNGARDGLVLDRSLHHSRDPGTAIVSMPQVSDKVTHGNVLKCCPSFPVFMYFHFLTPRNRRKLAVCYNKCLQINSRIHEIGCGLPFVLSRLSFVHEFFLSYFIMKV